MKVYDVGRITIGDMFQKRDEIFVVPPYQRRYCWGEKQWEDLWKDVDTLDIGDTHFLASLVVISPTHNPTGDNELELVDGQQRVTTLGIILCALRDYFHEKEEFEIANNINQDLLNNKDIDSTLKGPKIILGNLDHEDYIRLLNKNLEDISNENIKGAYEFFYDKICDIKNLDEVKKLYTKLIKNCLCVVITVTEDSDAYRLFETLNYRGLDLSPVDLMKNHLFRISDKDENTNLENIKTYWADIIRNLDGIGEIRFFRQYIMSSKFIETREKVTESKLYEKFKTILKDSQKYAIRK